MAYLKRDLPNYYAKLQIVIALCLKHVSTYQIKIMLCRHAFLKVPCAYDIYGPQK